MRSTSIAAALLILHGAAAFSQTPPAKPEFDAASVKPAQPIQPGARVMLGKQGGPGTQDPGHVTFHSSTLMDLIRLAYDVKDYQVTGPSWLTSERYEVEAKLPASATKEQFALMLQSLLAERFHLTLHHESKEFQGYELVVGKGGSKLKETSAEDAAADPNAPPPPPQSGPPKLDANGFIPLDRAGMVMMMRMNEKGALAARMTARAQPVAQVVDALSNELKRPVVDKTGLTGKYDFTLGYAPENVPAMMRAGGPPPPPPAGPNAAPGAASSPDDLEPTLTTAIQQQLGLRLDAKKIQLDILVIDKADKTPTEN
jgi:uncharacterized protein (TIGR03435 family)